MNYQWKNPELDSAYGVNMRPGLGGIHFDCDTIMDVHLFISISAHSFLLCFGAKTGE